MEKEHDAAREAAFEFGRLLGDPAFRRSLPRQKNQDVLVVLESDRADAMLRRVLTELRPPALIAIRCVDGGFVYLRFRISLRGLMRSVLRRRSGAIAMLPDMTVGALYESLKARPGTAPTGLMNLKPLTRRVAPVH